MFRARFISISLFSKLFQVAALATYFTYLSYLLKNKKPTRTHLYSTLLMSFFV